jgi:hypothetical protein
MMCQGFRNRFATTAPGGLQDVGGSSCRLVSDNRWPGERCRKANLIGEDGPASRAVRVCRGECGGKHPAGPHRLTGCGQLPAASVFRRQSWQAASWRRSAGAALGNAVALGAWGHASWGGVKGVASGGNLPPGAERSKAAGRKRSIHPRLSLRHGALRAHRVCRAPASLKARVNCMGALVEPVRGLQQRARENCRRNRT